MTEAIYRSLPDENSAWLMGADDSARDFIRSLASADLPEQDAPIHLEWSFESDGRVERLADLPSTGFESSWAAAGRALPLLEALFGNSIKEYRAVAGSAEVGLLGVVPVLEGLLDLDRSDVVYFSTGRVMDVRTRVFNKRVEPLPALFRLAEEQGTRIYAPKRTVDAIEAAGLSGRTFRRVG